MFGGPFLVGQRYTTPRAVPVFGRLFCRLISSTLILRCPRLFRATFCRYQSRHLFPSSSASGHRLYKYQLSRRASHPPDIAKNPNGFRTVPYPQSSVNDPLTFARALILINTRSLFDWIGQQSMNPSFFNGIPYNLVFLVNKTDWYPAIPAISFRCWSQHFMWAK